ncbi:MAG: RluA family pseudouridine synthase [Candidatus Peribacteraceae bacterium]|nr:RluA family pseudouridine synthase [Candidatus Peribacteraceae bacterium]
MPLNPDRILYEDEHFLAVQKLSGELVVRGAGKLGKLPLLDFLRQDHPGLRPLHRLDFETSGVVLFAKTKEAYEAAVPAGKGDDAEVPWTKSYVTLLAGKVKRDHGEISTPLPARSGRGLIPALTRFKVLERFLNATFAEAQIETGRHHQIRRHFAKIGHPLAADQEYGDRKFNRVFIQELRFHHFFLHASSLSFIHPFTKQPVRIEAPVPKAFQAVLKKLRKAVGE